MLAIILRFHLKLSYSRKCPTPTVHLQMGIRHASCILPQHLVHPLPLSTQYRSQRFIWLFLHYSNIVK